MEQIEYPHQPKARWADTGGDDKPNRFLTRMISAITRNKDMTNLLGTVMVNTDVLLAPNNEWIGQCRVNGKTVKWSLWAPHKRMLIDIFPRALPPDAEILEKDAFARSHGIRYLLVPPGRVFGLEDLKTVLQEAA